MPRGILLIVVSNLCIQLVAQTPINQIGAFPSDKLEELRTDTDRVNYLLKIIEGQHQSAPRAYLEYAAKALAFAQKSGSKQHLLNALRVASKCYFYSGFIGEAATYIEKYADLAERYGTDMDKAFAYNDLATLITLDQDDRYSPEARKLFEKTLELFFKIKDSNPAFVTDSAFQAYITATYSNIAIQFKLKGDLNKAEFYLRKAMDLLEKTSFNTPLGLRTIANYMDVLQLQGREQELFRQYDSGMAIINETGYASMSPLLYYPLAKWYASRNDLKQAIAFYQKIYAHGQDFENHSFVRSSASQLSKLYEQSNNPEAALKFSRIADQSAKKEKMAEIATSLKQAELKAQFRAWEQEVLHKNRKRVHGFLWITGLTLGIALSGFLYSYQMRRKYRLSEFKRLETELSAQKLLLEKKILEADLETSNKALASEMMRKSKQNELISNTLAELHKYSRRPKSDAGEILKLVVKSLNNSLEEDTWMEFDLRFKKVDQRFYAKLAEIGPDLTIGERRMCTFVKLDMSSKEISTITGQKLRAIEMMRTRIRKKLGITNAEITLSQFLTQL